MKTLQNTPVGTIAKLPVEQIVRGLSYKEKLRLYFLLQPKAKQTTFRRQKVDKPSPTRFAHSFQLSPCVLPGSSAS